MFADVSSANVVGYANKMWTEGCTQMFCAEFKPIGDGTMTLGDIVPGGNWTDMNDVVKVFDGAPVKYNAMYLHEATVQMMKSVPGFEYVSVGWWKKDPVNNLPIEGGKVDSEPLPLGCTLMANAATAGAYLTSNGEVIESETGMIRFTWTEGCTMMVGNCTPINRTLADFVPGGNWTDMNDVVKVFDGAPVKYNAMYLHEATVQMMKSVPGFEYVSVGWWKKDPVNNLPIEGGKVDNEPIPAGCGVMANAATAGAYVEIPSAL